MADNLFQVLGIQTREDCVSNAIAYAIKTSARFRECFLQMICDKKFDDYRDITAYTRVSIPGYGTPDVVLVCKSPSVTDLIVIENKLGADEGEDQTATYASEQFRQLLQRKIAPGDASPKWTLVFLTLFPDQEPSSNEFTHKTYEPLTRIATEYADGSLAEMLIRDWIALLNRFYEKQIVRPNDDVVQKLHDEDGLGSGYLYFREAFRQIPLPPPLQIDDFFRSSQQGRRYYGAVISKEAWRPAEMIQNAEGRWHLDPVQNFHVHFEPQFDVLNKILKLYLHYEVYPYQPEAWVRNNVPASQYTEYVRHRTRFFDRLRENAPLNWSFGLGYNQIARADLNFDGQTFSAVSKIVEHTICNMSIAVDETVRVILQ